MAVWRPPGCWWEGAVVNSNPAPLLDITSMAALDRRPTLPDALDPGSPRRDPCDPQPGLSEPYTIRAGDRITQIVWRAVVQRTRERFVRRAAAPAASARPGDNCPA